MFEKIISISGMKKYKMSIARASYLVSPSIFEIYPNIWANEFGIIPLRFGSVRTPSIVNVLPVPVCPYAKTVPRKKRLKCYIFFTFENVSS